MKMNIFILINTSLKLKNKIHMHSNIIMYLDFCYIEYQILYYRINEEYDNTHVWIGETSVNSKSFSVSPEAIFNDLPPPDDR